MEKWLENLEKSKQHIKTAENMAYITFSLLKENRLIIKILSELYESSNYLITALLQYESSIGKINIYKDPILNLRTFKEKIAPKYFNIEDAKQLVRIFELEKKHRQAPVEFIRKDKFVILLGDKYETLTILEIKEFLSTLKKMLIRLKLNPKLSIKKL
ncbi:MAG: hypothetical protein Q7S33_03580 [Nanoarchaeota archaeon]|nr:hypothetical protein [Nanoarchaeota archaeon]